MVGFLALLPGTLLFPASAGAIPGHQGALISGAGASTNVPVTPPSLPPAAPLAADQSGGDAGHYTLTSITETGPEGQQDADDVQPTASIPCLQGLSGESPLDNAAADNLCVDNSREGQRFSVQFGSRIGTRSGILGDFDGIRVDYRLTGGLTLNGVAGYPVLAAQDKFNATRQVFGISAETGKFARAWNLNSYLIEEQDNGRADSRAVGGAIRYSRPKRSLLLFLERDVGEDSLNAFMVSGSWKLPRKTTLSATFDVRNSPILKRQEKYLQKSMAANEGWTWLLPADRINHFTSDRSSEVTTMGLGLSHVLSQRIKLSGDVAMLEVSSDATADDSATAEPPSEYFYRLNLTGKDLMVSGDRNTLDFRHRVTGSSRISSAAIDARYAINRLWNVSPRLRADYRNNVMEDSVQWVTSPAVKMEYRWREQIGFQIEAGGEWSSQERADEDDSRSSYFVSLGYQANF